MTAEIQSAAYRKAKDDLDKARDAFVQAYADLDKAVAARNKAGAAYNEARAAYNEAVAAYNEAGAGAMPVLLELHAKLCPCCPWDGETIFPGRSER